MLILWALWGMVAGTIPAALGSSTTFLTGYVLPNASVTPMEDFTLGSHTTSIYYGGFVEYKIFKRLALEIGALYGKRGFKRLYPDGANTEVSFTTIQIPVLMRYYFHPVFSFGLGGYFSHGLGTYSESSSLGDSTSTAYGFGTYGADDYGGVLSLAARINLLFSVYMVMDARYVFGFQNISHFPDTTTSLRDMQFLIGISFGR